MSEKLSELNMLVQLLNEFLQEQNPKELKIADTHPVIYAGNPHSNIVVINLCPDRCELSWAKNYNVHNEYVCFGPNGNYFRDKAKRSGFNPSEDFFYLNMVPYYPLGGEEYTQETITKFLWITNGVLDIVQPKVIITLGYKVLKAMFPELTPDKYRLLIYKDKNHSGNQRQYQFIDLDEYIIVPLEHPDKMELENLHNFYSENLARLFLKVPFLKKDTQQ